MMIDLSSKIKMVTLATAVLTAPLAASAQSGQTQSGPTLPHPSSMEKPDWGKIGYGFAKSMTQFMQGWAKAGQAWTNEIPKMMEAMKEQCVNCHAVKDQMYRDLAERFAKQFSDYMKSIKGHKNLGEQVSAEKKPR